MILLGKVEDVFRIAHRGVVVAPEFCESLEPNLKFGPGDQLQFRASDGFIVDAEIEGIEFVKRLVPKKPGHNIALRLSDDPNFATLKKGMEIWLLRGRGIGLEKQ
jgi:hypothetical protein